MSENLDMSTLSPATTLLVKSEKMLQFVGDLSESSCKTAMQRGKDPLKTRITSPLLITVQKTIKKSFHMCIKN
jgi:hypothetical protein